RDQKPVAREPGVLVVVGWGPSTSRSEAGLRGTRVVRKAPIVSSEAAGKSTWTRHRYPSVHQAGGGVASEPAGQIQRALDVDGPRREPVDRSARPLGRHLDRHAG